MATAAAAAAATAAATATVPAPPLSATATATAPPLSAAAVTPLSTAFIGDKAAPSSALPLTPEPPGGWLSTVSDSYRSGPFSALAGAMDQQLVAMKVDNSAMKREWRECKSTLSDLTKNQDIMTNNIDVIMRMLAQIQAQSQALATDS